MKPAPFAFARPRGLDEALGLLSETEDAKVLAGGQSLVPLLTMRLAAPAMLVDINGLPDLDHVVADDDGVRVGALARHASVLRSDGARRAQPLLGKALAHVAHATIRNRGTTVGSIVHADAAAEMPAVLALLGGSVTVVSTRGERVIGADDLFAGPLETTLAADEIAVSAWFPALRPGERVGFTELARRHGDYAMCGVAALVGPETTKVAYLSVNEVPTVVDLTGVGLDDVGDAALEHLDPQPDIHATAAYRSQLVRVLTRRVLEQAA